MSDFHWPTLTGTSTHSHESLCQINCRKTSNHRTLCFFDLAHSHATCVLLISMPNVYGFYHCRESTEFSWQRLRRRSVVAATEAYHGGWDSLVALSHEDGRVGLRHIKQQPLASSLQYYNFLAYKRVVNSDETSRQGVYLRKGLAELYSEHEASRRITTLLKSNQHGKAELVAHVFMLLVHAQATSPSNIRTKIE